MSDILHNKAAKFISLGCKLNFAENSTVCDLMEKRGAHRAAPDELADICIINTCTVTETANHKSRQAIHKVIKENPGAFIVVMGCYAQMQAHTLAEMEGVDLVVGMEHKGRVVDMLEERLQERNGLNACLHEAHTTARKDIKTFVPSCSRGNRTRYFIKIQDGCDYFCSYCAIPYSRGRSRNGSIESLVKQAEQAAAEGGKEIVITGVNIGDFGKSTDERLMDLLRALDRVDGIERFRISSIEPNLLTEEIIDFCASSRAFMPHFHIPLQSGSDGVLSLMRRKYDTALFQSRIDYIHAAMPEAFIGVDVITGTRGETPQLWEESLEFIRQLDVAQLHVFPYSERPGTAALSIPYRVDEKEKHRRCHALINLSEEKRKAFYQRFVGSVRTVLTEHAVSRAKGFTDNYIQVEMPDKDMNPLLRDNRLVKVHLDALNEKQDAVVGHIVET